MLKMSRIARITTLVLVAWSGVWAAINNNGHVGVVRTLSAKTTGRLKMNVGLGFNYAMDNSFVKGPESRLDYIQTPDGREWAAGTDPAQSISGNIYTAFGLTSFWDIAVAFPVYVDVVGVENMSSWGVGDLAFSTKLLYPPPTEPRVFYQSYLIGVTAPTGAGFLEEGYFPRELYYYAADSDDPMPLTFYASDTPNLRSMILWTLDFGNLERRFPMKIHANIGAGFSLDRDRENTAIGNLALEFAPSPVVSLFVDASGESRWRTLETGFTLTRDPLYLSPGIQINAPSGISLMLAGDFCISSIIDERRNNQLRDGYAYSIETRPRFGAQFAFAWSGFLTPQDDDNDGIKNDVDRCPKDAEDIDEYEDSDGCPDEDNDSDGLPDVKDKCPNKAEDTDGFEDEDGCPENDNDGDGILDVDDQCPKIAEDFDGIEDKDGCPDGDNDKDGIPDSLDKCPNDPEDVDKFEDDDGCPDIDNDKDGIQDLKDKCPNEPEAFNGVSDEDGCPDEKKKDAPMPKHQILKGVKFRSGSVEMTFQSHQFLDPIIKIMKEYPDVEIEIRGHTDSVGKYESNMRLSQMRAESVRQYLISQGIEPSRMRAVGFGPSSPIADNRTAAGRSANRRIEVVRIK